MHRFRSLLVYIDSRPASRAALEAAWALAQRTGARVTVMDVVPEVRPSGLLADAETWTEKLVSARLGELEAQVAAWRALAGRWQGSDQETDELVGDIYRNEAIAGDVYFIHGGLRLGSRG